MSKLIARFVAGVMLANTALPAWAAATDLSELPILMANAVTPAMVLAVDDSGSMDFESLLSASDGALWWNTTSQSFVSSSAPNFNTAGVSNSTWQKYAYLFPNGNAADARGLTDSTNDHFAIPPTDAYAWVRSADYNPMYYDSAQTYIPWKDSVVSGVAKTFANATPSAARSHPVLGGTTPTTFDLTSVHTETAANWTFKMQAGMVAPAGAKRSVNGNWTAYANDTPLAAKTDVAIPYYPATFYKKDATCTAAAPVCVTTGPDGAKLRRYEIKTGNTFPSGRSYADEMQNFANWFTYYRKRVLMLNSSLSLVLPQLSNMRMGMVRFNAQAAPTMSDFSTSATAYQTLLGTLQSIDPSGGTPTRETLKYIGDQYSSSSSGLVQYSCQRNATMVISDGFAYATTVTPPAYSTTRTVGTTVLKLNTAPYTTITAGSLADIASSYWIRNIRSDLTAGMVPVNPSDTSPAADMNPDPHINTYALTLGAKGTIYGTGSNQALYPYTYAPAWPVPNTNYSPTAVDDLWHATINSRGKMMSASNSGDAITSINAIIADILGKSGAGAAIALSNVNLQSGDNTAYFGSFVASTWYGDLVAEPVDPTTGAVSTTPTWSLKATLAAKDWTTRLIASNNGSGGVDFSTTGLSAVQLTSLNNGSATDNATVINFVRGDRSLEGTAYRTRSYVLGDIIDAEPVYVKGSTSMVYQAANDGMLHAVNAATGQEAWAYIPSFVIKNLNKLTNTTYSHTFYVDGTPAVAMVGSTRLLVGGLRNGGPGYYALDITDPTASTVADVVAKVKWEFPNSSTSTTDTNNVGYSYGKPIIAPTTYGNVVLVTSGYNNTSGDGKGHLFVLNPATGAVIRDLATTAGTATTPSGLAQISAYNAGTAENPMATLVYGGDLLGNIWKFDLTSATPSAWSVSLLATVKDASGAGQPITSAPELGTKNGKPAVYVGTGQLLGNSDKATTQTQSIYMILDKSTALSGTTRSNLVAQTVTVSTGGVRTLTRNAVDLTAKSGWYFDLPAGEKMNVDPQLAYGLLVFNTNAPSPVACSSASYIYAVDMNTGGMMPDNYFSAGKVWAGQLLAYAIASRSVVVATQGTSSGGGASGAGAGSITCTSDGKCETTPLPITSNRTLRKVGWREPRF